MTDAGKVMITPKGEYDASVTYEKYDNVSYSGVLYIALKTVTGIEPTDDGTNWMKWIDLGSVDVNSLSPTFTEATDRVNVMSGETIPTLFGKIKKWFTDLKEIAFSGSYNDLSDTPTIPAAVSVKGNNETAYRTGEVNLTAEDIGAVTTDGDTAENTVAFTSADSTTANAWTDVSALATGEKHSSIFNKVSTMFKNIRFLYKMLGTTDISAIGDGTVTNALSTLNSNLEPINVGIISNANGVSYTLYECYKIGKIFICNGYITFEQAINKGVDFLHFDLVAKGNRTYIPVINTDAGIYFMMDKNGYIKHELSKVDVGSYAISIVTVLE